MATFTYNRYLRNISPGPTPCNPIFVIYFPPFQYLILSLPSINNNKYIWESLSYPNIHSYLRNISPGPTQRNAIFDFYFRLLIPFLSLSLSLSNELINKIYPIMDRYHPAFLRLLPSVFFCRPRLNNRVVIQFVPRPQFTSTREPNRCPIWWFPETLLVSQSLN